ncbi:MAG: CBS domain-containing protein, partial [Thermoleophilia bacterium]|nr:CBS domain-containing protein [Thermoleophilia bacterium]
LTFGDRTVGDIMVPRTEMVAFPTTMTVEEAIEEIARTNHTRYPV